MNITLYHTEKLPAIAFIKPDMIGVQVKRRDSFRFHILYGRIQEASGNSLTAVGFFSVHGTYIWCKILPVMKIVINNTHSGSLSAAL